MLNHLIDLASQVAALVPAPTPTGEAPAPAPAVTEIDTKGVITFMAARIAPILFAVLGVIIIARSRKGQVSETLTSSLVAIVGVIFIAGAGIFFAVGGSIIDILFE